MRAATCTASESSYLRQPSVSLRCCLALVTSSSVWNRGSPLATSARLPTHGSEAPTTSAPCGRLWTLPWRARWTPPPRGPRWPTSWCSSRTAWRWRMLGVKDCSIPARTVQRDDAPLMPSFGPSVRWGLYTTTEHRFSNTSLCYYMLINVLLAPLVTHLFSVTNSNVTTAKSIGTQHMCYCTSKKVLLLSNTIPYLLEHLWSVTKIIICNTFLKL